MGQIDPIETKPSSTAAILANDAQVALERVAKGEADAIEGWLAYGAALNEGRALFPSDEQFGQWVEQSVNDKLSFTPNLHERAAAMWAAANPAEFAEAKAAGNARTLRTNLALKLESVIAARAKQNLSVTGKAVAAVTNQGIQKSENLEIKPVSTQHEIAKIAGVSHDSAPSSCTIGVAICSRLVR